MIRGVAGLADAALKYQFRFGKRRGAVLLMSHAVTTRLEPVEGENTDRLMDDLITFKKLKGKVLVTETISCKGYFMYLSNKGEFIYSS